MYKYIYTVYIEINQSTHAQICYDERGTNNNNKKETKIIIPLCPAKASQDRWPFKTVAREIFLFCFFVVRSLSLFSMKKLPKRLSAAIYLTCSATNMFLFYTINQLSRWEHFLLKTGWLILYIKKLKKLNTKRTLILNGRNQAAKTAWYRKNVK